MRYLDRYLAGQYEQVWTELLGVGGRLRYDADVWAEARLVAEETMRRVRDNVERLRDALPAVGYRFRNPEQVLVSPAPGISADLDRLEAEVGALPLAFRVFCEVVGTVDLSGEHPRWPHELLDPLIVDASVDYYLETRADMIEQGVLGPDEPFDLDFAPDDLHKADISGGPPYAVRVPDASIDSLVLWEVHQTTFVNYLRTVMRLGGMGGMGAARHHGHEPLPVPPEVLELGRRLEPF